MSYPMRRGSIVGLLAGLLGDFFVRPTGDGNVKADPDVVDRVTDLIQKERKNHEASPSRKKRLQAKQRELK
jgi:hypothetical protein